MICACRCQQEFEPKRRNQIYVNAEHRQKDKERRWPRKRYPVSPVASRNGLGKRREPKTSGGPPHPGDTLAQIVAQALRAQKRRKIRESPKSAEMLTAYEVSRLLRVSYYTVLEWRKNLKGPPSVTCSPRVIRYPRRGLGRWLRDRTVMAAKGKEGA